MRHISSLALGFAFLAAAAPLVAAQAPQHRAAAREVWIKTKGQRDQAHKLIDEARGELRTALTPEHQKQFDDNVARFQQRLAQGRRRGSAGRRHDGDRAENN